MSRFEDKTCPDWKRLAVERGQAGGSAAWGEAREHLRACPHCRQEAIAVDPSLLFVAMAPVEVTEDEVHAMQQAVAQSLRRRSAGWEPGARDAVRGPRWRWLWSRSRSRARAPWLRVAATVALLVGFLALRGGEVSPRHDPLPEGVDSRLAGEASDLAPAERGLLPVELLEEGNEARLYHLAAPDLAVVMVFDETLPF